MFDSALELFSQAASSSLFIFFFCNLIIVMILVGSKSGSEFDQKGHVHLSIVTSGGMNEKQLGQGTVPSSSSDGNKTLKESDAAEPTTKAEHSLDFEGSKMLTGAYKESDALESHADDCDQVNGSDNDCDELERRVEEFILKVNKEWRRELLRTSGFV